MNHHTLLVGNYCGLPGGEQNCNAPAAGAFAAAGAAAGAFAAAGAAAAVCDDEAEAAEGPAGAPPATFTPLPLLKPSKLQCEMSLEVLNVPRHLTAPVAMQHTPVLQSFGDVAVPSAGVRVLGGLGSLLNLRVDNEIVLRCVVPATICSCCQATCPHWPLCAETRPTHQYSCTGRGDHSVPSVLRPCSDLGRKQPCLRCATND